MKLPCLFVLALVVFGCVPKPADPARPSHDPGRATVPEPNPPTAREPATEVSLTPLTEGIWLHTSTRVLEGYGSFPSHGLVVEHPEGALLIDTAWGPAATRELLVRIEQQLGRPPRAAIVTDFHDDRAGGIAVLEATGMQVWTSKGIARRLEPEPLAGSVETFETPRFEGRIAGLDVEVLFPGPGHSPEGLVVWLPQPQLLFGGCLIRPLESQSLGNLADADLQQWGPSVRVVREHYGRARIVVPSHGAPGDRRLLEHTLALVDIAVTAAALESGSPAPSTKVASTVDDLR